tara:strand:- start:1115 stop:2128 length:1014 start_codon:yes stop_codon:yes gene_type:complete
MTTFYDILGISKEATQPEIKKAYRGLSLKYHPDRNSSEDAKEKIVEVNDAYETLSDTKLKDDYDTKLQYGDNPFLNMNNNDMPDINNLFNMMFGGGMMGGGHPGINVMGGGMMGGMMGGGPPGVNVMGGGPRGINVMRGGPNIRIYQRGPNDIHSEDFAQNKPEHINKNIDISLIQSYKGEPLTINNQYYIIENNVKQFHSDEIHINIPKGIGNGETIIIPNKGNIVNSQRSELRICINIINNTIFKRNGLDLILHKEISLKESLCGFEFMFEHLNGKKLNINTKENPYIIKTNSNKVINNLGIIKDNLTGNLIIVFEIKYPTELTSEQIEGLKNIL